ncbi:hypothetical protein SNEBB_006842 [Seison nebaliae]|nr:hypothetical protein SNEBB_006842 [Seison nebaliae]
MPNNVGLKSKEEPEFPSNVQELIRKNNNRRRMTTNSFQMCRTSKFRHVFPQIWKRQYCFTNLRIAKVSSDSLFCTVNPHFIGIITECSGGGNFIILRLDQFGRIEYDFPLVSGHNAAVLDLAFSPHDDFIIASAGEDALVQIWKIPDSKGITTTLRKSRSTLNGHEKRVTCIRWHPCASDILASASADSCMIVWNVKDGEKLFKLNLEEAIINEHLLILQKFREKNGQVQENNKFRSGPKRSSYSSNTAIHSIAWSHDGRFVATASKDHYVRIWNIRPNNFDVIKENDNTDGDNDEDQLMSENDDKTENDIDRHNSPILSSESLLSNQDNGSENNIPLWNDDKSKKLKKNPISSILVDNSSEKTLNVDENMEIDENHKKKFQLKYSDVPICSFIPHEDLKSCKIVWLKDGNLLTTGFSRGSERQLAVWKLKNCNLHDAVKESSGKLLSIEQTKYFSRRTTSSLSLCSSLSNSPSIVANNNFPLNGFTNNDIDGDIHSSTDDQSSDQQQHGSYRAVSPPQTNISIHSIKQRFEQLSSNNNSRHLNGSSSSASDTDYHTRPNSGRWSGNSSSSPATTSLVHQRHQRKRQRKLEEEKIEQKFLLDYLSKLSSIEVEQLHIENIDNGSGILYPIYDVDTNLIYLCGKGDSMIQLFEYIPLTNYVPSTMHQSSHYNNGMIDDSTDKFLKSTNSQLSHTSLSSMKLKSSSCRIESQHKYIYAIEQHCLKDSQRGIAYLPKRGCHAQSCEIARFFRLQSDSVCQIISMIVPRRRGLSHQTDIYPPTLAAHPALSSYEWISGKNSLPVLQDITFDISETPYPSFYLFSASQPNNGQLTNSPSVNNGADSLHSYPAISKPSMKNMPEYKMKLNENISSDQLPTTTTSAQSITTTNINNINSISISDNKFAKNSNGLFNAATKRNFQHSTSFRQRRRQQLQDRTLTSIDQNDIKESHKLNSLKYSSPEPSILNGNHIDGREPLTISGTKPSIMEKAKLFKGRQSELNSYSSFSQHSSHNMSPSSKELTVNRNDDLSKQMKEMKDELEKLNKKVTSLDFTCEMLRQLVTLQNERIHKLEEKKTYKYPTDSDDINTDGMNDFDGNGDIDDTFDEDHNLDNDLTDIRSHKKETLKNDLNLNGFLNRTITSENKNGSFYSEKLSKRFHDGI